MDPDVPDHLDALLRPGVALDTKAASDVCKNELNVPVGPDHLAKLRSQGGGPPYHKVGRYVRYTPDELRQHWRGKVQYGLTSTSDARLSAGPAQPKRATNARPKADPRR